MDRMSVLLITKISPIPINNYEAIAIEPNHPIQYTNICE